MSTADLPPVRAQQTGESTEDYVRMLAGIVAVLRDSLEFVVNGNLSSTNAREFGGWLVGLTELQSKDGKVGMSTQSTDADDIRYWAGDVKTGAPKFKVTESGIASLVSALIQSAVGYPRVEINGTNNALTAYKAAASYLAINPNLSSSVPGIEFVLSTVSASMYLFNPTGTPELLIATPVGQANIEISPGIDLLLNPSGNLKVNGAIGYTGSFSVVTSVTFGPTGGGSYTSKTVTVNKGIVTSVG